MCLDIHNLFDLGKDLWEVELANTVSSLTSGDLSLSSPPALYSRLGAIMRWYGSTMPDDSADLRILLTLWWQLGNMRHLIVLAVDVTDESERARIPAVTARDHRPTFEEFAVGEIHCQIADSQSEQDHIAILNFASPELSSEMGALGFEFVLPYGSIARDYSAIPPAHHFSAARILAALSMGLTSAERSILWQWTSNLWDSGACWSSLLETPGYRRPCQSDEQAGASES